MIDCTFYVCNTKGMRRGRKKKKNNKKKITISCYSLILTQI